MSGVGRTEAGGLGRRIPTDTRHIDRYPLRALDAVTTPTIAERYLTVPLPWRDFYNQGREGACVGFSVSQMMSVLNRQRYDARWLWDRAKERDDWPDTNPGDNNGTSVRAALEVLRDSGHRRVYRGRSHDPRPRDGVAAFRWATTVDEVRWALQAGIPVVVGANWYRKFDTPTGYGSEFWLDRGEDLGDVRGGHAFMLEAVSDRRQAVRTPNTWGRGYPRCWISYATLERLLREHGEASIVTDR